ncbi:Phage portal protein, SPP1 Gp6-like [Popillia japonica]|uniref:Phage portal protein, SPP1 Gp6-like n=1 Tax=Popillia japonica TaxID=7064 RepID=A0AAW1HVI5_POPJA
MVGFKDLTELHNEWLLSFLFGLEDQTLLAHRGSFKTSDLSLAMALLAVWMSNHNIMFFRKTDTDVAEIVMQTSKILKSDVFQIMVEDIHGQQLKFIKDTYTELKTNLPTNIKGASQLLGLGIGTSITGKHADIVITDDIVNIKDRISRAEREHTKLQYQELQNIKNRSGRFINTGTPWHKEDAISMMPNVRRYDCYSTGLMTRQEIKNIRESMTDSLFAANYELKHIADKDAMFTNPQFTPDETKIYNGIAHIDASYGGADGTAFTIMKKIPGGFIGFGKRWNRHVDECLTDIAMLHEKYRAGTIWCEDNADKGYLRKELNKSQLPAKGYHESTNKYVKISSYLKKHWKNITWLEDTDPEYINEILDYTEHAEHDDSPDSAATDDEVLNEQKLGEFLEKHKQLISGRLQVLQDAYMTEYPIKYAKAKPEYKPDNRIAVNFAKYITDTMNGFFIGIPIKVTSEDETIAEYVELVDQYNDQDDNNAELAKQSSIFGFAYEMYYVDEDGRIGITFLSPMESFMIYDDSILARPRYFVRLYVDSDNVLHGSISDESKIWYFTQKGKISFDPEDKPHGFDGVPATEYQENDERMGLYEPVLTMINAYNKAISEKANDVDYFSDAYLKILGAKMLDEDLATIRDDRIINFDGDNDGKLVVEFLEKPSGDETQENLINRLEKLIFQISMVANISDENFGGASTSASGISLKYKLQAMSNLAKTKERKFTSGMNRRYKLIFSNPLSGMKKDDWVKLKYKFTMNFPANLLEESEIAGNLQGVTSKETAMSVLSIVDNVKEEMDRMEKEQDTEGQKKLLEQLERDEAILKKRLSTHYDLEARKLEKQIASYYSQYGEDNVIAYRTMMESLSAEDRTLLMEQIDEFVRKYPQHTNLVPVRESIYQLNRLEGLQYSIRMQMLEIGAWDEIKIQEYLERLAARGANSAMETLGFGKSFYSVDSDVVRALLSRGWADGSNFSADIWTNSRKLTNYLTTDLAQGIARGDTYQKLTTKLRERFSKVSRRDAYRLVYTEGTFIMAESTILPFEGDFESYRTVHAKDKKVCQICIDNAKETFRIKDRVAGTNFPAFHPWCRCTFEIVVEDWDLWMEDYIQKHQNADDAKMIKRRMDDA